MQSNIVFNWAAKLNQKGENVLFIVCYMIRNRWKSAKTVKVTSEMFVFIFIVCDCAVRLLYFYIILFLFAFIVSEIN